ncbi:MAG: GMC family oxidoreductase N-terminal domain-containing protein [Halioglobus sp.]
MARVTRRQFIQRSSLLVAGSALGAGCSDGNDKGVGGTQHAIVIGSGFAGSVAALRLGQAGIATTVLERGQQWATQGADVFPGTTSFDRRSAWTIPSGLTDTASPISAYAGLLETVPGENVSVQCGACVGGGSLVYGGVLIQPRREVFNRLLPELSYDDMDSIYYPRVIRQIGAAPIPDDVLASPTYTSHRVFIADSERAGFEVIKPNTSFDWDIIRQEIAGDVPPAASIGDYAFGCNSHAKLSTDKNYLRDATATGNVEVRSLTEVEMIRELDRGYAVVCRQISTQGELLQRFELQATHVFMAAGSMNSSKLLLKSQLAGELKGANDRIGYGWGTNGDQLLANFSNPPVTGPQGGPACIASIDRSNPEYPVTFMHSPWPGNSQLQLAMSVPDEFGQLGYDPVRDAVQIRWSPDVTTPSAIARRASFQRLGAASGGAELNLPGFLGKTIWHPLGGTVMGDACDHLGQLYGYRNLFVLDGSLLPGSAATVNPALTVAANAERIMEALITAW